MNPTRLHKGFFIPFVTKPHCFVLLSFVRHDPRFCYGSFISYLLFAINLSGITNPFVGGVLNGYKRSFIYLFVNDTCLLFVSFTKLM